MQSDDTSSSRKWGQWNSILTNARDVPKETGLARQMVIPVLVAVCTLVALIVILPPFVCSGDNNLSFLRLVAWSILAAVATALVSLQGCMVRYSSC
jgi:hypothetical protein